MGFVKVLNYYSIEEINYGGWIYSNVSIEGINGEFRGFNLDGKIYLVFDIDHDRVTAGDLEAPEQAYRVINENKEKGSAQATLVKNSKTLEAIAKVIMKSETLLLSSISASIHDKLNKEEDFYDLYQKQFDE